MPGTAPEAKPQQLSRSDFEQSFLPLFEIFPDSIAILDADTNITRINQAFTDLLGYTEEEVRGRSLEIVVPEHLMDEFFGHKRDVLKGDVIGRESVRRARDGSLIEVLIRGVPIELRDGSPMIMAIYTDIRKRKEAERHLGQARDRAQGYLDTAGVMLLALDRKATITLINNKGCEILDCLEEDILGKNWIQTFIPEEQRDQITEVFNELISDPGGGWSTITRTRS